LIAILEENLIYPVGNVTFTTILGLENGNSPLLNLSIPSSRILLLDENLLLFEQNNEKNTRTSIKATVVGTAKVLSYEDIVEAQQKRDVKDAEAVAARGRRTSKLRLLFEVEFGEF
jgi:hypothetical protein